MMLETYIRECMYWFKRPAFYVYSLSLFGISFLYFAGAAGFFDEPFSGDETTLRIVNSHYEVNYIIQYFNKLFLFLLPAIVGSTLYKDYQYKVHQILYSFPIKKIDYLGGKLLSSLTIVLLVTTAVGLGMILAQQLPHLHEAKLGPFNLMPYVQAYMVYTIPNMIIWGTCVFAVVVLFRNVYAAFGLIILLFLVQTITQNAFSGNGFAIALTDPFAQNTASYLTQFWTLEDKNSKVMPLLPVLFYNRLLWFVVGSALLAFASRIFSFGHSAPIFFKRKIRPTVASKAIPIRNRVQLSSVAHTYSIYQQFRNIWHISKVQFSYIVKKREFLAIVAIGVLTIIFILAKVTNGNEMALLPITRVMLIVPAIFFKGIIILATFIYSGILVHRERVVGMAQLTDVTAVPDWAFLLGKVLSIVKVQVVLLSILILAGIIIQTYNGFYRYEIELYLFHLFGLTLITLVTWTFASFFIHTLFSNVYIGLFVLTIGWIGLTSLPDVGITTKLLLFNAPLSLGISDMNGYGNRLVPYFLVAGYWFVFGLLLLLCTCLLWVRGVDSTIWSRLSKLRTNSNFATRSIGLVLVMAFAILGIKIYLEESKMVLLSNKEETRLFNGFEKEFEQYAKHVQPKITSVQLQLDIFPEENRFEAFGEYWLLNRSDQPIDTLLIKTGFDEITDYNIKRGSQLINANDYMQFSVVHLNKTLQPHDSMQFSFEIRNKPNSYFEKNSSVLKNGTFIGQDILPRFGYMFKSESADPNDEMATMNNYMTSDADLVDLEVTMSTTEKQITSAPGCLQKEWISKGRYYAKYKLEQPIKFGFAFISGRYKKAESSWKNVDIHVFHHDGHDYNVDEIIDGTKAALAYNSEQMGPYQHREMRIVEFPESEGTFATTMGNTMPMSELRFIANTKDKKEKMDHSFYVAAHEMTHQWWGNQVVPANTRGAVMLSESVTEYITLRIYEQKYGKVSAMRFLKEQRLRYLKGRTAESHDESPLMLVLPKQQYIAYGKGSMAFNAMSHYIGEEKLNGVLRKFLIKNYTKNPPYPTSIQLVDALKKETPDSLQYVIEDWFETVTFYNNEIERTTLNKLESGKYSVKASFKVEKLRQKETQESRNTFIGVAVYDETGELIYLGYHQSLEKSNEIQITVEQKPFKIVLDPYLLMMDKDLEDNVVVF